MPLILRYLRRHWHVMAAGLVLLVACDALQLYQPLLIRHVFNEIKAGPAGAELGKGPDSRDGMAGPPAADGPSRQEAAGEEPVPDASEPATAGAHLAPEQKRGKRSRIALLCISLIVVIALTAATRMFWRLIVWPRGRRMEYEMRRDLFDHMRGLPPAFFHASTTGDLMSRATSDIDTVRRFYSMGIVSFMDAILILPLAFILMARMDLGLALAAASPLLIGVPLSAVMMRRLHAHYKDSQDSHGVLSGRVQEDIAGVRALKTYAREDAALGNFDRTNADYTDKAVRVSLYDGLFEPYFRFVPQIGFVAVLAWGGWKLHQGEIQVGDLVAFLAYVGLMVWPIFAGGMGFNMLQRARASARRLEEILAVPPEERPGEESGPERFSGRLAFRELAFTHQGQTDPTIRGLSLELPAGTVLGITGPTGSGKSTLLYLAAGLLPAPVGTVMLDDADVSSIGRGKLRRAVTLVEQTPFLFSRSLEDNLAYGREDADAGRVREAVRMASLDADVERFENGLDTVVGERGVTLSGGQRLRAALARALVVEPRVLLLDDVFSAVDVETEKAIWGRIRPHLAGTTVLVVSHRTSVLRECDRIAVIQDGALGEYGTHEELLRGEGFYARTFALQEQFES